MSSATAAASEIGERWGEVPQPESRPAAILKGGPRGLEIIVDGGAAVEAIAAALTRRLEEAPGFFRGNDVRVRVDGALPAGCLARLDEIATRFELTIVEVGPRKPASVTAHAGPVRQEVAEISAPVPQPALAAGTAPTAGVASVERTPPEVATEEAAPEGAPAAVLDAVPEPSEIAVIEVSSPMSDLPSAAVALMAAAPAPAPDVPASAPAPALALAPDVPAPAPEKTRMVVGPVRSGVILDHPGNLVVVGDVNPGAEVRAQGNIVILGRLRGIAHAGIGRENGFILALRLEPQQLRIGRVVARASEQEAQGNGTEIAHVTDKTIVVERYAGRLPPGLAAGI